MNTTVIVLAAGKSKRFNSKRSKVLHLLAGKPIFEHVIDVALEHKPEQIIFVTSPEMEALRETVSHKYPEVNHVIQEKQEGTGSAIKATLQRINSYTDRVLILYGDHPLLTAPTIGKVFSQLNDHSVAVIGFHSESTNQYGRLSTQGNKLTKIVEYKNASEEEKLLPLCNSGILAIRRKDIELLISHIKKNSLTEEYYLTDVVEIANNLGLGCSYVEACENEVMGINTRAELSIAEGILQSKIRQRIIENGVTILEPSKVTFCWDTKIGRDSIIHPYVVFGPNVVVGEDTEIKSFSHLEGVKIKDNVSIGPYARIRPGTIIHNKAKIGNFVEVKNSTIMDGSKINHLSYIGDSEIGKNTNIGAGTITCNYDGIAFKYKTIVGNNVSIGSNSSLIAPIEIKDGAIVAAGSVISSNVESNALAIARKEQINIAGKAAEIRKYKLQKKQG